VAFVRRDEFLRFVTHHPEAYPEITKQLSDSYEGACERLRNAGISSANERVGQLLLEWSIGSKETTLGQQITLSLTQAEIGELLGVTRETVSRALTQFRNNRLVVMKGSTLTIPNRAALESFIGSPEATVVRAPSSVRRLSSTIVSHA